jgi:hypothetical protein
MKKRGTPKDIRLLIKALDDESLVRFYYCYQLGSTFVLLNKMERTIIHAMGMCDRIRLAQADIDLESWDRRLKKQDKLEESTLGSLIQILARHGIIDADLKYLRWLKGKRDQFIHRWFRHDIWPGEMSIDECRVMARRLLYLEITFHRASEKIWKILERASLIAIQSLGSNGSIMVNPDAMQELFGGSWLEIATELTLARIEAKREQE